MTKKIKIRQKHLHKKISNVDITLLEYTSNGNITLLLPYIYYMSSIQWIKTQKNEKFDSPFDAICLVVECKCMCIYNEWICVKCIDHKTKYHVH